MYEYIGIDHRSDTIERVRRVFLNMFIFSEELDINIERNPAAYNSVVELKDWYTNKQPSPTSIGTMFKRTEGEIIQNLLLKYGMLIHKNGADEKDLSEVAYLLNLFNDVLPHTYRLVWWLELAPNFPKPHTRSILLQFHEKDYDVWRKFLDGVLKNDAFLERTNVTKEDVEYLNSLFGSYTFNITKDNWMVKLDLTLRSWSLIKHIVHCAIEAADSRAFRDFDGYRDELERFETELSYSSVIK